MEKVSAASILSMQARSLDIPTEKHPNKMPFSGVLTRIGEPSDTAPSGSGGKRVMLTMEAAEQALDSLLGMAVDFTTDFDGHDPQAKIGVITGAEIKDNALCINGFIYAADFPDVAKHIKANKKSLGFSFEARELMTTDAEADPVPIVECIFTGAAILLKDKAAYRTTSILAQAGKEDFIMDDKAKQEIAEIVAAALKPMADSVAAAAAAVKKLEDEKVQAANFLSKVEKHASEMEKVADHMEANGIGGDPRRGHATILRDMAGDLRANAAKGILPATFDRFWAAADKGTGAVNVDEAVKKATEAVTADFTKKLADVQAAAEKAAAEHKDALKATETKLADIQAAAAKVAEANAPERKTFSPALSAEAERLLTKTGLQPDEKTGKLDMEKLNTFLAASGLTPEKRMEFKTGLAQVGMID